MQFTCDIIIKTEALHDWLGCYSSTIDERDQVAHFQSLREKLHKWKLEPISARNTRKAPSPLLPLRSLALGNAISLVFDIVFIH